MEEAIYRSPGHCMVMGTASTMSVICEALGMTLPGGAAIPGADSRRRVFAERAGATAVDLVHRGARPSALLTEGAFENAALSLLALGGSTNAIIHPDSDCRACGYRLSFEQMGRTVGTRPCNRQPETFWQVSDGRFLLRRRCARVLQEDTSLAEPRLHQRQWQGARGERGGCRLPQRRCDLRSC